MKTRRGRPRWKQTLDQLTPPLFQKKIIIKSVTPDTWHLTLDTWHLTPDTWHLTPDTWHMTPDTWHMTPDMWHLTPDMWRLTRDTWHLTPDTWHMTRDTWHVTRGGGWTFSKNFSSQALTVWEWRSIEDIFTKVDWLSLLIIEWQRCL